MGRISAIYPTSFLPRETGRNQLPRRKSKSKTKGIKLQRSENRFKQMSHGLLEIMMKPA